MSKEKNSILDYFETRFGISRNHFREFEFYLASKGRVFLGPKKIPAIGEPVSVGILIARMDNNIKPTTNLLQLFGKYADKNIVSLTEQQTKQYAHGDDIKLSPEQTEKTERGYVILSYCNVLLGCGLLRESLIKNMLPKAKRSELKFM